MPSMILLCITVNSVAKIKDDQRSMRDPGFSKFVFQINMATGQPNAGM